MKRIVAYVNTNRVHWLVEELQAIGIEDIMVKEYFKTNSQISRFEFLCEDDHVEEIRKIVHRVGAQSGAADHYFDVFDFDPNASSTLTLGKQIIPLENSL